MIADSGNWDIGEPALTTSLRGLVRVDVEVRTLTHAVHSGMWGGLVPDALMTLSRLIATLHDDAGNVAVAGLHSGPAADVEYPEERLRAESGANPGIEWIGDGSVVERLWTRPSLSITGLDAPKVDGASNTLVPSARAKISMRIAPGDTTAERRRLPAPPPRAARPVGRRAHRHGRRHRRADRRSTPPVRRTTPRAPRSPRPGTAPSRSTWASAGRSRSSPSSSRRSREASVLVTGVEDPDTRAHGANEGLHLAEFERVVLAEALLLASSAADPRDRGGQAAAGSRTVNVLPRPSSERDVDPAAVPLDDPLHDGQAQAGAGLGDGLAGWWTGRTR